MPRDKFINNFLIAVGFVGIIVSIILLLSALAHYHETKVYDWVLLGRLIISIVMNTVGSVLSMCLGMNFDIDLQKKNKH